MPRLFAISLVGLVAVACGDTGGSDTSTSDASSTTSDSGDTDETTTTSATNTTTTDTNTTTTDASSGSSGPTTDSSSGTTGDTSDTSSFVQDPDSGAGNECDPKKQDCMDGEKCAAWANDGGNSWNANKCVPVTGEGVAGDPCMVEGSGVSGLDDCAKGYMCWDVDEMGMGVCVQFCDENENCPPQTQCAVQNDGVLPICIPGCDPLLQDCPMGSGCYAIDGDNGATICIPDASGNGGMDGEPCEYDNVCDPGLICIGGSAGCMAMWCCTPWCDLSEPNTCPGMAQGEECVPHYDNPPPGAEDVGICVIPQ